MLEELIEKIWALRKKKRLYGYGHISTRKQGYNEGIKGAIRIINKAIPQPQDEPHEEGWWWFIDDESGYMSCIKIYKLPFMIGYWYSSCPTASDPTKQHLGTNVPVSWLKGKWCKAILTIPEVQNET